MAARTLRIVSWNVAGRVARKSEQTTLVAASPWDLVCLPQDRRILRLRP